MKWKNPFSTLAELKWLVSGACSGDMSAQGVKHAGEPTSDNKRERRRGAAGRAAVLRRAPSDSDCSGETASLSADSGERRPAPPPPRSGKTRGRRRGSEWEVLEGLKDGQRFERRPEVFNGYLHKKRKWPLKGWHKRFFVVDGGILVYARSPTDVARGRLHGSLDVGLSVISAKPRRRRIDIDADEFIYHLRAKTPDVFRTWLNVLKAHRLYRQHLLTFGARESVPKIHAPLDELPPTDTSSQISHSSAETFSTLTKTSRFSPVTKIKQSPTFYLPTSRTHSLIHGNKSQNVITENSEQSCELEIKIDTINVEEIEQKLKTPTTVQNGSLCSMCCIEKRMQYKESTMQPSQNSSLNNDEKQVHSTNLDLALKSMEPMTESVQYSFKRTVSNFMSTLLGECNLNPSIKVSESPFSISSSKTPQVSVQSIRKHMTFGDRSQTTLFFFSRKNRNRESVDEDEWVMKRSRKSTNVFKYRNSIPEPLLKRPISKCMLLAKYKLTEEESISQDRTNKGVLCDLSNPKSNKSIQDVITPSEYDGITEKLILTIFGNHMEGEIPSRHKHEPPDAKFKGYVNQVVKELYSVRQSQSGSHPVTFLFRSLLDYYLNNTGSEKIKQALQKTKSVPKQSNKHFTKDAMISSEFINSATKETQVFEKHIEVRKCENGALSARSKLKPKKCLCEKETSPDAISKSPKGDTDSFEKERRIQELERLMKNTVYLCETVQSLQSKENDIKITKTLINNLSKMSKKSVLHKASDEQRQRSDESTELPAIQDTINRLISETEMPPEMAKEFLHMYLDVLCNESSKHDSSSSRSSDTSKSCRTVGDALPSDGVQTEAVVKKVCRSVTVGPNNQVAEVPKPSFLDDDHNKRDSIDPGQLYLQEILDEITTVFTENRVHDSRSQRDGTREGGKEAIARSGVERSRKPCAAKNHVYEVKEDNSVVIDLSKYDLHRISMVNDVTSARMITVKIKLKEKPAEYGEWKRKHLSLKLSNDHQKPTQVKASTPWPRQVTGSSKQAEMHFINMQAPYITLDPKDQIELKPYISTSDATSKGNPEALHGSDSFNLSGQSSGTYPLISPSKMSMDSDHAQSFLLSSLRKRLKLRVKSKKQLNNKTRADSPYPSCQKPPDGFTVFEKESPGIIDERFILLLLENLTLLSKNLPEMYKEIGKIYLKLKKRHDKSNDNPNAANLSLLGNISKEPSLDKKQMLDGVTQYDATDFPDSSHHDVKEVVPIAVNTSVLAPTDNVIDKSVSAYELPLTESNQNKVIENNPSNPDMSKEKSIETQTSYTTCLTTSVENVAVRKDQAVSIQEWSNKLTQECAIGTVIKCSCNNEVLNFANTKPQEQLKKKDTEIFLPKKFKKKQSAKLRQDLIKQIKLLSSSLKVSTPSQTTEKKLNRHANCFEKDFRVYQLFPKTRCKMARSGSATDSSVLTVNKGKSDDLKTIYRCSSVPSYSSGLISPTAPPIRGPQAGFVSGTPGGRLASWIIESGGPLESASRELGQAQLSVQQLQRLLDALELQQQLHHDTDVSLEGASPNVKKDRRKFGLRKKKSNNKCGSVDLAPAHLDPSSSQMALSALTAPPSPGGGASSMPNSAASLPIENTDNPFPRIPPPVRTLTRQLCLLYYL